MLKRVSGALVAVAPGLFALPAHAEVPAAVTTALSGMQADALAVAGLVLVALIAVAAFKFMRKGI